MVADTNTQTEAAADAAKAQAADVAEATKAAANAGERTARTARKTAAKTARKTAKTARKSVTKSRRKAKTVRAKAQSDRNERNDKMKSNTTNMFAAIPGAPNFDKLFTETAERGEEAVKRSRKAAEELADMYRGNIDAFVEASRIAATGAQSIGQSMAAKSRDSIEQTANTVRSLAEAKSPTELLQLQSEYARSAFDRFVEDSSAFTESFVKLAGEAFQPISNRAGANVGKLNDIAA